MKAQRRSVRLKRRSRMRVRVKGRDVEEPRI